jgi:hypothetical protein
MDILHAVFRTVKENKSMRQSNAFGVAQPVVQEGIFCTGDQVCITRDIDANETGVAIIEGIRQIG